MRIPNSGSPGRTATVLVLIGLLLIVTMGAYLLLMRVSQEPTTTIVTDSDADTAARLEEAKQLTVLLTILLVSSLLVLLFVVGAYLLIRVGRIVARTRAPVGGQPTQYVDAWTNYRLTDEEIAAATQEDGHAPPDDEAPDDKDEGPEYDEPGDPPYTS